MIAISPQLVLRAVAVGVVACVASVSLWGLPTQGGADSGDAHDRDRGRPTPGVVAKVVDGDTVRVRINGPAGQWVRLLGVDAPEVPHSPEESAECYGQKSARALAKLLPRGSTVTLETDPSQDTTDSYGRLLRYLTIGGIDVGEKQIKAGAAVARPDLPPISRAEQYAAAQEAARSKGSGLWSRCE